MNSIETAMAALVFAVLAVASSVEGLGSSSPRRHGTSTLFVFISLALLVVAACLR